MQPVYIVANAHAQLTSVISALKTGHFQLAVVADPELGAAGRVAGSAGCIVAMVSSDDPAFIHRMLGVSSKLPFIALIDAGDTYAAIACLRGGAFDCLVAPVHPPTLVAIVEAALMESTARTGRQRAAGDIAQRLGSLTDREHELVPLICEGLSNKQVAARLDISIKTVANHRAQILKKTAARNTAHMVRLVTLASTTAQTLVTGLADVSGG